MAAAGSAALAPSTKLNKVDSRAGEMKPLRDGRETGLCMVVWRKRLIFQHGQTRHLSVPMVAIGEYTETSMRRTMPTEVGRHHARLECLKPEPR